MVQKRNKSMTAYLKTDKSVLVFVKLIFGNHYFFLSEKRGDEF